jgi:hypothetical protein
MTMHLDAAGDAHLVSQHRAGLTVDKVGHVGGIKRKGSGVICTEPKKGSDETKECQPPFARKTGRDRANVEMWRQSGSVEIHQIVRFGKNKKALDTYATTEGFRSLATGLGTGGWGMSG